MSATASTPFDGIAIITGANSGLGFETARKIASMCSEATVVLACRNPARGDAAQQAILESTGNTHVKALPLDLSSLESVRAFAANCVATLGKPIDSLVWNAGIAGARGATVDGLDPVFETNHLGHFLLTLLLLPHLSPTARILSVSSDMHQPPGPKLIWPGAEKLASAQQPPRVRRRRYSYSKLCNLYFTYELTRMLGREHAGISSAAFNPGLMTDTNFATMPAFVGDVLKRVFVSRVGDLDTSSTALAHLATSIPGALLAGRYFDRTDAISAPSSDLSYNQDNARELWQVSAQLVGEKLD